MCSSSQAVIDFNRVESKKDFQSNFAVPMAIEALPWIPEPPETPTRTRRRHQSAPGRRSENGRRPRTTSMSSSRKPAPLTEVERPRQGDDAATNLCKSVFALYQLLLKQSKSPLRCSESSSRECAKTTELRRPTDQAHSDAFGLLNDQSILSPRSRPPLSRASSLDLQTLERKSFKSLSWDKQRVSLQRQFKRLIRWEPTFGTDRDDLHLEHDMSHVPEAYSRIGRTLAKIIRDDSPLEDSVKHIQTLLAAKTPDEMTSGDESIQGNEDDPLGAIQTAIDELYKQSHQLKRKRSLQPGRSMPDLTALSKRPARQRILDEESGAALNRDDFYDQNEMVPVSPRPNKQGKNVHFSIESLESSTSEEEDIPPQKHRRKSTDESGLPEDGRMILETDSTGPENSTIHRVVLNIASGSHVFREAPKGPKDTTASSGSRGTALSQTSTMLAAKGSGKPIVGFEGADIMALSHSFKDLGFETQLSSGSIVTKLLNLAQAQDTLQPELTRECDMDDHTSRVEVLHLLSRFQSILGLFTSLPEWDTYTVPELSHVARSAISVIYFSFVEEIVNRAAEITDSLKILSQSEKSSCTMKNGICSFIAGVAHLVKLDRELEAEFRFSRPLLQETLTQLASSFPRNEGTRLGCGSQSPFRRYQPLSIALYLAPTDDSGSLPNDQEELVIPTGLESLSVRDLYRLDSKTQESH